LYRLFIDPKYADLTVTCGTDVYRLHKSVVCPRSDFFAKACEGNFKEGRDSVIHLDDDDGLAVRLMVYFFYHLDYPQISLYGRDGNCDDGVPRQRINVFESGRDEESTKNLIEQEDLSQVPGESTSESPDPTPTTRNGQRKAKMRAESPPTPYDQIHALVAEDEFPHEVPSEMFEIYHSPNLIIHTKVYQLASAYFVKGLDKLACNKFERELDIHWNSSDFAEAVMLAYASTEMRDTGLRNPIIRTLYSHPELLDKSEVQDIIFKNRDLSYGLI
ncbi:hypothetical protein BDY21DRAFT_267532, partial [Lineolata rhizophorae]